MANKRDARGTEFQEGQPVNVTVNGHTFDGHVIAPHEDGVSVVDNDGHRHTFHASDVSGHVAEVMVAGVPLTGDELRDFHTRVVEQTVARREAPKE